MRGFYSGNEWLRPRRGSSEEGRSSDPPSSRLERWRALSPALAVSSCGCFLPDLTRFTRLQCGGARQMYCMPSEARRRAG